MRGKKQQIQTHGRVWKIWLKDEWDLLEIYIQVKSRSC